MYLVTVVWRGSLHITPMRVFSTYEEGLTYATSLSENPRNLRIYKLSSDAEPILLKAFQ